MARSLILINPWIYDFAAYDMWSKPLGLLTIASMLRRKGFDVRLIDCLDIHDPGLASRSEIKAPVRRAYGIGKFPRERIPVPEPLARFNRPFHRYGLPPDLVEKKLKSVARPAAVLVTSIMTYWYPAVKDLISLIRKVHPGVPVILGGIYATLCSEHALSVCGADIVVPGGEPNDVTKALSAFGIEAPGAGSSVEHPYPAFDMLWKIDYICLLTTRGCPFSCRYCASSFLQPHFSAFDPLEIVEQIQYWHKHHSVEDFAFYDDALLVNSTVHVKPMLEEILRRNLKVRFHTPNALHAAAVTKHLARLMRRAGFRTIRLGLETADFSFRANLDNKMKSGDMERAAACFLDAGFHPHELGAYILAGLPGQTPSSVRDTIIFAGKLGFMPFLAEYSPLPHTALWEQAVACAGDEIRTEPLLQNNTVLPCWEAHRGEMPHLKQLVKKVRSTLRQNT
ncbi:MAG: cobalamin-dependent protein [Desulfatiglandaceae bacterium]